MSKDVGSSICIGLVEEDMELKELGEVSIESNNLIYAQKSNQGTLFVDVKGMILMIFFVNNLDIRLKIIVLIV